MKDMESVGKMNGAKKIVETCAAVQPGEQVLIVSDWLSTEVAESVAQAAQLTDAEVTMSLMDPREYDGNEPPESVARAMADVDVILAPVHRGITHSSATERALHNGVRFVDMIRLHPDELLSGGLYADYESMRPTCDEFARMITEASTAHVTSAAGTDAEFSLDGSTGNSHPGIADEPGDLTGAINIEANTVPEEGATDGTLVFDASVPHFDIGVLERDIRMDVDDGKVVTVDGGAAADRIERIWDEVDHPAVYNIAQLAVGLNPKCTDFNGRLQNDHGVYGSVHVGIGTSSNLGGGTRAPIHFDAMMGDPTVTLDDTTVIEEGKLNESAIV